HRALRSPCQTTPDDLLEGHIRQSGSRLHGLHLPGPLTPPQLFTSVPTPTSPTPPGLSPRVRACRPTGQARSLDPHLRRPAGQRSAEDLEFIAIAVWALAGDPPDAHVHDHRLTPPFFARVDVG